MKEIDLQVEEKRYGHAVEVSDDADIKSSEELSHEAMLALIHDLQVKNKQLLRTQAELAESLRAKEALLENADTVVADNRQTVHNQATNDPLTGLLKLRGALKLLSKELARNKRNGEELAIGLCDIDGFKELYDTYGHRARNEVLCWVAQTLTTSLREYDTVARIGGEKFLLIMPLQPGGDAESVCERICEQISKSKIATVRGDISVTVSIGIAYAAEGSAINVLRSEADAALSHAKKMGCNRTVFFAKA